MTPSAADNGRGRQEQDEANEARPVGSVLISGSAGVAPAAAAQDDLPSGSTVSYLSQVARRSAESSAGPSTLEAVEAFLLDLAQAGRSDHTLRAYRGDLARVAAAAPHLGDLSPTLLRAFFGSMSGLAPTTRARRQAAVASFTRWCFRDGLLDADPMGRVARLRQEPPLPRGVTSTQVDALLRAIPPHRLRDRLLFRLLATTGLRVGEALALHVEDCHLERDDERLSVLGKGGRRRTVLLDDREVVRLLRRHLRERGYKHGPLFRAERGQPLTALRYSSVQERFAGYAAAAGVPCSIHDLRHGHAQALVNGGVSLATIRKRLGHASVVTTQRYAEQADEVADAEVRAWSRTR